MILSVVIVIASDTVRRPAHAGYLRGCLQGLREQSGAPALEIVVPHLPGVRCLDELAREFPEVRFLEIADLPPMPPGPYRNHHDDLRSRGIRVTTGPLVALLEDHEVPDAHWAARLVAAHAGTSHAAVGGAVENVINRPLNRAVWLCDFARYLNPLPAGPSLVASDVNVAYRRRALDDVSESWTRRFNERSVHEALIARGHTLALSPEVVVYQRRAGLRAADAVVERFAWGRSYAATRAAAWSRARCLMYGAGTAVLPVLLVARVVASVAARRRFTPAILAALPWTVALAVAWSLGECAGYAMPDRLPAIFPARTNVGAVGTS